MVKCYLEFIMLLKKSEWQILYNESNYPNNFIPWNESLSSAKLSNELIFVDSKPIKCDVIIFYIILQFRHSSNMMSYCSNMTSYLANKDVSGGVQRLRWWRSHHGGHEPRDITDQKLHDSEVVQHGDEGAEEHDDGQNLE